MDQAQLIEVATQLIGVISPFIAQTSPQEGSAQANSVASDPLKPVREILQRNFAVHPKAQATLMLYEDEPNDAAMQQRMIQQIATIFQNDVSTLIELVDLAIKLQTSYLQSKQVAVSDKPQGGALMEDPELQRTPVAATGRAQTIAGESRVGVGIVGDVYGNIYYASERSKSATELLQAYYERQIARHSIISLQGFRDQMAADDALNIKLDQIYTQVTTVQSKQSITRAVATNKTLVILGEPGGGKSTVLRFLTLHLSRAGLDDQYDLRRLEGWEELSSLDEDEQYETPYALTEGAITTRMRLFPILLPLLPLSRRIAQHPDAIDYDSELWNYVAEHLETVGHQPGLANVIHDELENAERAARQLSALRAEALKKAEAELDLLTSEIARLGLSAKLVENQDSVKFQEIVDQIQEKRKLIEAKDAEVAIRRRLVVLEPRMWCVILLLDGLDEVGTDNARQDIVRAIQAFAQTYPQCRIAVTCRVRAYEGEKNAKWHLAGWPVVTLADWTLEQMQQYIKAWYLAAGTIASMSIKTREEREASLSEAIATRADLQRLGTRPLLLTIMALVHFNDARLAENRATLYRRCIDILLGQWELGKGQSEFGTITDYVKMPNADVKQLRPLLQPTIRVFSRQRSYAVHQGSVKITGFLIDNPQTTLLSCKEPLA